MNRAIFAPLLLVSASLSIPVQASWSLPFISEIHYDNAGSDVGEFVAVTGPAGLDLAGWQLALYNGGDGRLYRSVALTGTLDAAAGGLVEAAWTISGIQNGPDAVALVSPLDAVVDFIAYEAAVSAVDGAAQGLDAQLLPVAEDSGTAVGHSLQRIGSSGQPDWIAALATPGLVNPGLSVAVDAGPTPEPEGRPLPNPGVTGLWLAGLVGWLLMAGRRRLTPVAG